MKINIVLFISFLAMVSSCMTTSVLADGASSATLALEGISVTGGITQENMEATLDIYVTDNPTETGLSDANMGDAILNIRVNPDNTSADALTTLEESAVGRVNPFTPADELSVETIGAANGSGEQFNDGLLTIDGEQTCGTEEITSTTYLEKFCERGSAAITTEACSVLKSIEVVREDVFACSQLAGTTTQNCTETAHLVCDNPNNTVCNADGIFFTDGGEADDVYDTSNFQVFVTNPFSIPRYVKTNSPSGPTYVVSSDYSFGDNINTYSSIIFVNNTDTQIENLSITFRHFAANYGFFDVPATYSYEVLFNGTEVYNKGFDTGCTGLCLKANVSFGVRDWWSPNPPTTYTAGNARAIYDTATVIQETVDVTHLLKLEDGDVNVISLQSAVIGSSGMEISFDFTLSCCVNPQIVFEVAQCD